jgi:predicted DNA binding CopG/RHH family protein
VTGEIANENERRQAPGEPNGKNAVSGAGRIMNTVMSWEEVPLFTSEEDEAEFWGENRIDVRLMESAVASGSDETESVTITLRMDPRMLARIKRLARSRYLNYQSMIKQWLSERMEDEMRERRIP